MVPMKNYKHRNDDSRTVGERLSDGHAKLYTTWDDPDVGAAAWHIQIAEAPYDVVNIAYGI